MTTKTLPPELVQAYRERLAARWAAAEKNRRPPIVWQGAYDDLYERAMAWLEEAPAEFPPAAERAAEAVAKGDGLAR